MARRKRKRKAKRKGKKILPPIGKWRRSERLRRTEVESTPKLEKHWLQKRQGKFHVVIFV